MTPGTAHLLPGPREAGTTDPICSSLPFPNRGIRPRPEFQASGPLAAPYGRVPNAQSQKEGPGGVERRQRLAGGRGGCQVLPSAGQELSPVAPCWRGIGSRVITLLPLSSDPLPQAPLHLGVALPPCPSAASILSSERRALCLPAVCGAGHAKGIGGTHSGKRADCRWVRHPEAWGADVWALCRLCS